MDFINEEYVLITQVGQDSRQVAAPFDSGTGSNLDIDPHLGGDDVSQGSLAQARWAIEQDVVEGVAPTLGGGDSDIKIFFNFVLPDEIIQGLGAQTGVKGYIFRAGFVRNDARHSPNKLPQN